MTHLHWRSWGPWLYITTDMELQFKRCRKCDKTKVRRTPKEIIRRIHGDDRYYHKNSLPTVP